MLLGADSLGKWQKTSWPIARHGRQVTVRWRYDDASETVMTCSTSLTMIRLAHHPQIPKCVAHDIRICATAYASYADDVRSGAFPGKPHFRKMKARSCMLDTGAGCKRPGLGVLPRLWCARCPALPVSCACRDFGTRMTPRYTPVLCLENPRHTKFPGLVAGARF